MAKTKSDDNHCSALIHWASCFITGGNQFGQVFTAGKSTLVFPITSLAFTFVAQLPGGATSGCVEGLAWGWLVCSFPDLLFGSWLFVLFHLFRTCPDLRDLSEKQSDFAVLTINCLWFILFLKMLITSKIHSNRLNEQYSNQQQVSYCCIPWPAGFFPEHLQSCLWVVLMLPANLKGNTLYHYRGVLPSFM